MFKQQNVSMVNNKLIKRKPQGRHNLMFMCVVVYIKINIYFLNKKPKFINIYSLISFWINFYPLASSDHPHDELLCKKS